MSTLYIFADEAGTMPMTDDGGVFVTSAIAFFDAPPTLPISAKARNRDQFVKAMIEQGGLPSATLLIPYPGYERNVTDKFDQWEAMGLVTLETTGANRRYLRSPDSGKPVLSRPNLIWAMYMQDVIHNVLVKAIVRGRKTTREVRIVLDQKTLGKETKEHFRSQLLGAGMRLRDTIRNLPITNPKLTQPILEAVQFDDRSLHVQWEGDSGMEWAADGLALADTLASSILTDHGGRSKKPILELLERSGISNVVTDRTEWAKAPVHEANRRKWEETTGARILDVRDHFKVGNLLPLKPEYKEVCFRCDESDLPHIFRIVTAHNPDGQTVSEELNLQADAALATLLEDYGWRHFRVIGGSPDFTHAEPGYGIECSREEALKVARRFRQDAIFEVNDGVVLLIDAKGANIEPEVVGAWMDLTD